MVVLFSLSVLQPGCLGAVWSRLGASPQLVELATHASWCPHLPSAPCVSAPLSQVSLTLLKHLVSKHSPTRLETLTGSGASQAQDNGVNSEDAGTGS